MAKYSNDEQECAHEFWMIAGSFRRKTVTPAYGDLESRSAEVRGAVKRERPGEVELISSAGVLVVRTQVLVIARMSGCKLSVRSLRAVICEGVRKERLLRVQVRGERETDKERER